MQGYEGFEKIFVQCYHNENRGVVEAKLASFDSAEVKVHRLSDKKAVQQKMILLYLWARALMLSVTLCLS